jgi:hypothetical protein
MKKLFWLCIGLLGVAMVHAAPPADLIARIHFAGAEQIAADPASGAFTNLWLTPEAQALRAQTFNKLSTAPYTWLKEKIAAGAGNGAAQLRPLLDDLISAEWFFEARDSAGSLPEFVLAIRLKADRAQLWQNNLATVLEAWTKITTQKIPGGWLLKKHLPPDSVRFVRVGDWVVFSCEQGQFTLGDDLVQQVTATKRPLPVAKDYWFKVDADWPRLAKWFPAVQSLDLPETKLSVIGRDGNLHVDGKLVSPQSFGLALDKWRVPTNSLHQPFISLTAARGITPWLKKQSWTEPYEISPMPNQMFIWALAGIPFQTFAAVPVPNGDAALAQLRDKLKTAAQANAQGGWLMPLSVTLTNHEITLGGIPFAAPFVRAVREPAGDFLLAGLFPNTPRSKPLPPELFTRLATPSLVFYHWEITAERLKLLLQPAQLVPVLTRHQQLDGQSAAAKWLDRIGPPLGNTVTEVTQTAPNELTFTRKAPAGLTAIELFALASWLEAKNFPGCDLRLPPPRVRPGQKSVKALNAPAAPAPH